MKIVTLVVCLLALAGPLAAQDTPQAAAPAASAPTRVMSGAKIYIAPRTSSAWPSRPLF